MEGAIFTYTDITLSGNTFFEGNLVSNCATSLGGAIYLGLTTSAKIALLNATGGDIAFSGNKVGVDMTGVNPTGGTANSIHLDENKRFDITGGGQRLL